ncbi:MAG: epoxyqueuosine reductase [Clostridia bacterium]|nr:epoxyqueuosine reductase [Clostridia bacterium]
MNNNEFIKEILASEGIDEVGFSITNNELPYAITIVVPLSEYVIDKITDKPTFEYFHHYRTVNSYIDRVLLRCGLEIAKKGYKYVCVGASQSTGGYVSYFPHKTAARLSGLGYIGKNCIFISEKYGPSVRLGTLLTDMPFKTGNPIDKDCGECNICKEKCPAMAIYGVNYREGIKREEMYDAKACSEYMKKNFQSIGRGAVCGICIKNCPKRKK